MISFNSGEPFNITGIQVYALMPKKLKQNISRTNTLKRCPLHHLSALLSAKSIQLCPTLCDPMDGSPSGSPVPGILQARTLERVAISFSNAWKWKVKVKSLSHVQLFATPWTAAHLAPPSMGFSRQESWSGVPLPSPARLGATKWKCQRISEQQAGRWFPVPTEMWATELQADTPDFRFRLPSNPGRDLWLLYF